MNRSRSIAVLAMLALATQLTACASMQEWFTDVTPRNVEEGIAAGYVTLTAANKTFTDLVNGGVFKKADAERISAGLDSAGTLLRSAREQLQDNNLEGAEDYLALAKELLQIVQNELDAKS